MSATRKKARVVRVEGCPCEVIGPCEFGIVNENDNLRASKNRWLAVMPDGTLFAVITIGRPFVSIFTHEKAGKRELERRLRRLAVLSPRRKAGGGE